MVLVFVKRGITIKLSPVQGRQTIPVKAVITHAKDVKTLCPVHRATL